MIHACTPEELGVSSRGILDYLKAVKETGQELHNIVLLRHGKVAWQASWAPAAPDEPHMLFSLSKSFTSMAAAFAVSEGLMKYTDRVIDLLPKQAPAQPSEWMQQMTVHHLLTMTSGLDEKSDQMHFDADDVAQRVLSYPVVCKPGSFFHYNSLGTYLVSRIVQELTGQPIVDYLLPRLFAPLGIPQPYWERDNKYACMGGWGLRLDTLTIAKVGQLLLQKGIWEGKRILPEFFFSVATVKQADNSNGKPDPDNDWCQGYGYQFWRCVGDYYRGDGACGQLMIVIDRLDAVIAVTAAQGDMGIEIRTIREKLVAAIAAAETLPEDEAAFSELQQATAALRIATIEPTDDGSVNLPEGIYRSENGDVQIVKKQKNGLTIHYEDARDCLPMTLIYGETNFCKTVMPFGPFEPPIRYCAEYHIENGKLILDAFMPGGPAHRHGEITLTEDGFTEELSGNMFTPTTTHYRKC